VGCRPGVPVLGPSNESSAAQPPAAPEQRQQCFKQVSRATPRALQGGDGKSIALRKVGGVRNEKSQTSHCVRLPHKTPQQLDEAAGDADPQAKGRWLQASKAPLVLHQGLWLYLQLSQLATHSAQLLPILLS